MTINSAAYDEQLFVINLFKDCKWLIFIAKSVLQLAYGGIDSMIIGKIIRQLRNSKGIGIRELERLTGINRGNISKIERGAGFGPLQLKRLADQLNTTPAVIFALSEILQDKAELLEDTQQIASLCSNLTRLFEAYTDSPQTMKNEVNQMLAVTQSASTAANAVFNTAMSASSR